MQRFAIVFLRNSNPRLHSHAFLKTIPPPSLSFSTLASTAAEGALETRNVNVRKARGLKAGKIDCGSLHAEIPTSIAEVGALETRKANVRKARSELNTGCVSLTSIAEEKAKARPTSAKAKRKAKAKASELSHIGVFKAEDVIVHEEEETQNTATGKAQEAASHAKFVVPNAAIERSEEVASNATANESIINAKKELSEWVAKLDLNISKRGRQWEETAYKLLDHGISSVHVKKMLPKCRRLQCSTNSVDSTLKHFTMLGMSHEEMGRVISIWPTILNITNNVFQSKVELFESVGIGRRSLGKIMHLVFRAMGLSPSTLRGRFDFWKDYFQDVQENAVCALILRNPNSLAWNLQKTVLPKIAYLEKLGFNRKMLLKHSTILGLSRKTIALKLKLLEQFGISNATRSIKALAMLHGISILSLHARLHNLLALGFSFDQVQKTLVKHPQLLTLSEDSIKLRLSYAVYVMNLSFDMLVAFPMFWGYSFEKRIKYRYGVLQELKTLGAYEKNISLSYLFSMSDTDFSRRFVKRLQAYTKHSNI